MYSLANPDGHIVSGVADVVIVNLSLLVSMSCLLYIAINAFRYYLNRQGKLCSELNRNSYGVYIIHVIVLGVIAVTMLHTTIPSSIKFLILTAATYGACNLIVSFYRTFIKSRIMNRFREEKP
jgi:fucose 4-O-acetylase-like acetyltransferase